MFVLAAQPAPTYTSPAPTPRADLRSRILSQRSLDALNMCRKACCCFDVQIRAHVCKVLAQELKPQLQQVVQQADACAAQSPANGFTGPAMSHRQAANAALSILACDWDARLEQQLVRR